MQSEEGLQLVLTPVQLAAILSDQSVSEGETISNRLWGAGSLLFGALELIGSVGLCRVRARKACITLAAHSLDAITTGANQLWTGVDTNSSTYKIAAILAKELGADDDTAHNLAKTIEVAVPIGVSVALGIAGAFRVRAIRFGRIKLSEHELMGGHTIAQHVGKTKEELLYRLKTDPRIKTGVSSFTNLDIAEKAISQAIKANKAKIKQWSQQPSSEVLRFNYNANYRVGGFIKRGSEELINTSSLRVVLVKTNINGKRYYILTSFPKT
ncbi:RNase A-like domain-containing protein [Oligella urethralis]|uniref:RNase A-like domain-containing protein n=1 Tax=Oligella urethralis TaxID=90245 RepID=UPI000C99DF50|nr:RNase A-like domain-containing protein [Oligella urethralis]PMC18320.1 hypothetical protein CJ230_03315 [Oligella urethralis]